MSKNIEILNKVESNINIEYDCNIYLNKLKCHFKESISNLQDLKLKIINETDLNISPSLLLLYHNIDDYNLNIQESFDINKKNENIYIKVLPCENIFINYLPKLNPSIRILPQSKPSINFHFKPAKLEIKEFQCLKAQKVKILYSSIWSILNLSKESNLLYCNENDIGNHVSMVIQDIIAGCDIKAELKYEFGIYSITSMIWVISNSSNLPIGVVQFKKPNEHILNNSTVWGELFNYMIKLREMYGLKYVFGISTTYNQWRVNWLPESNNYANLDYLLSKNEYSTIIKYPNEIPFEINNIKSINQTLKKENNTSLTINRLLYGTEIYNYTSKDLPMLLFSVFKKMYYSERKSVIELLDKNRKYMLIDKEGWSWVNININSLKYLINIDFFSINSLIVLMDISSGYPNKVYLCSTLDGFVFILKYSSIEKYTENGNELKMESNFWKLLWNFKTRVDIWNNKPALMMPFLLKANIDDWNNTKFVNLVLDTIKLLSNKGLYYHDLKKRHVGKYIDKNNNLKVVFFGLSLCEQNRSDNNEIEILMKNNLFK